MPEHESKIVPLLTLLAELEESALAGRGAHEVHDEIVDLFVLVLSRAGHAAGLDEGGRGLGVEEELAGLLGGRLVALKLGALDGLGGDDHAGRESWVVEGLGDRGGQMRVGGPGVQRGR